MTRRTQHSAGSVFGDIVFEEIIENNLPYFAIGQRSKEAGFEYRTRMSIQGDDKDAWIEPLPFNEICWRLPSTPKAYESLDRLWTDFEEYYLSHVHFVNRQDALVSAGFDLATWIHELFEYYTWLAYLGAKGSGKTLSLKVHEHLCYRGFLLSNPTVATVFRIADEFQTTLLVNETDLLAKGMEPELENMLLSTNERDIKIPRVEGEGSSRKVKMYQPGGFRCFAGTVHFGDTLADRTIPVYMSKGRAESLRLDVKKAEQLRSQALMFRLRTLTNNDSSTKWRKRIDDELLRRLENPRLGDIIEPLYWLALESQSSDRINQILDVAKELDGYRKESEATSLDAQVIAVIASLPDKDVNNGKFATETVRDVFNLLKPEREHFKTQTIGRIIAKFGFRTCLVDNQGRRISGFYYDSKIIQREAKRFGISFKRALALM